MVTKKNSRSPWAWIPTLYFAEGLPNVIVTALSVVMYMQLGLTDAEVGLYTGWLALPWVIKPLWSPFIDLLKTKRWWVLTMQALIGAALAGIAFSLPTAFWFQATMCFFFLIAFCSATHDISADGFYMIELDEHTQTKFVGLRNTFYPPRHHLCEWFSGDAGRCTSGSLPQPDSLLMGAYLLRTGRYLHRFVALPQPLHAAPEG